MAAIAACSSTASDDSAAGGTAGTATSGGSGGTAASGAGTGGTSTAGTSASAAGDTGEGGAPACTFNSDACTGCINDHCSTEVAACTGACQQAIFDLDGCLCDGTMSAAECETTFITDGGTKAKDVADCFDANCKTACE